MFIDSIYASLKKRKLIAGFILYIGWITPNYAQSIFQTDFESIEGYALDALNNQQDWTASDLVAVDSIDPFSGLQFIWLPVDTSNAGNQILRTFNAVPGKTVYVDFYLSPNAATSFQDLPDVSNLPTMALSGLVNTGNNSGEWAVVYGDGSGGGTWQSTGSSIELEDNAVPKYLWCVYKLDYDYKVYDFFVNGYLIAENIPFIDSSQTSFNQFRMDTDGKQDVYFDKLTASYDMPLALDHDKDGLLTTTEDVDGDGIVDPGETDFMSSDTDGDFMGDAIEQMHGFDPLTAEAHGFLLEDSTGALILETGFETVEGFSLGDLNGQSLWQAKGLVEVMDIFAFEGTQSIKLTANTSENESAAWHYYGTNSMDQVWISFYGKLSAGVLSDVSGLDSSITGIFKLNESGNLAAFDGYLDEWLVEDALFDAGYFNDGEWKHYVVHLDYLNRRWTLIAEGGIVFRDIQFGLDAPLEFSYFKALQLSADLAGQSAYFDKLVISDTEPEGLDFDFDGILNRDERDTFLVMGLDEYNPNSDGDELDDGEEDFDDDGDTNAYEFAQGRLPTVPDADVSLYADSTLGNDANYNGLSAVPQRPTVSHGPKASIASTLAAAENSAIILLQSGIFDETTLTPNGKDLTLRTNGSVTIR